MSRSQALVENLQREGLNDADKGEGIAAYIKLREESTKFTQVKIRDEVCSALGLSEARLSDLLKVASFQEATKKKVRQGEISGSTAVNAARVGGEEFVKVAAENKLPQRTVQAIGEKLRDIADPDIKEKVRAKIVKGEVTNPEKVVQEARRLEGQRKRKDDNLPDDLLVVIGNWTVQIKEWTDQLDQVIPYIDYIDSSPKVAERFRAAVRDLVVRLEKFL